MSDARDTGGFNGLCESAAGARKALEHIRSGRSRPTLTSLFNINTNINISVCQAQDQVQC